jgi:hypothetical protein
MNKCFEALKDYYRGDRFLYVVVDGHTFSPMSELRFRSKIFPDEDGKIRPIIFLPNPKSEKK